jgi:hypothetical protein
MVSIGACRVFGPKPSNIAFHDCSCGRRFQIALCSQRADWKRDQEDQLGHTRHLQPAVPDLQAGLQGHLDAGDPLERQGCHGHWVSKDFIFPLTLCKCNLKLNKACHSSGASGLGNCIAVALCDVNLKFFVTFDVLKEHGDSAVAELSEKYGVPVVFQQVDV